jgi:hypothetical protein
MLSCLPCALSASFWPFLTLKALKNFEEFENLLSGYIDPLENDSAKKIGVPRSPSELEVPKGWHLQKNLVRNFLLFKFCFLG